MAWYAIGDVQGCYGPLRALVDSIDFDPAQDRLWFTGDLVNRGPDSLSVLRWVKQLGASATVVLGNHDLHLLARAGGHVPAKPSDTLDAILGAPDRDELLLWLRRRPLMVTDENIVMIHAGLAPGWSLDTALACAREAECVLNGPDCDEFLRHMYGDRPDTWSESLDGWPRIRVIINAFTRLRYCNSLGAMALHEVGPPGSQAGGLRPWYEYRTEADRIWVFGHWAAHGRAAPPHVLCVDQGCVWGRELCAVRIDQWPPVWHAVSCPSRGRARDG